MLSRGNLTPKEKFILLIQNDIARERTGKEILTPADKEALENWKAQNNSEAHEWNTLNEGWKHIGRMEIEVELYYKDAHTAYLAQLLVLTEMVHYPSHRQMKKYIENIKGMKIVTIEEAAEIAKKQKDVKLRDGVDFDYAVYQLAFERMTEKEKEKLKDLYVEIEYEHQYLDQEEVIANLLGGKEELTEEAKEKLADLVAEQSYNKFAREYQLFHYFACIPLTEVARYFLKDKGIEIKGKQMSQDHGADDEQSDTYEQVRKLMEEYAAKNDTSIKAMLKEACLKWLDDGLLDEYTPLVLSTSHDLFQRWLEVKKEARKILLDHVQKGELKLGERSPRETRKEKLYSRNLYDKELENARNVLEDVGLEMIKCEGDERVCFETFDSAIVTGQSVYDLKADYDFVKKFRERTDEYDPNLGIVYSNDDPEHGEHLDREFLICDHDSKGEPSFLSVYGLSINLLSSLSERNSMFKEEREDGKIVIKFKNQEFRKLFKERRQNLISNFATLLAFEKLFKRLVKIFDTDFTYHVAERIRFLKSDIMLYNDSILIATNAAEDDLKKTRHGIFKSKEILHFEDDLIIDVDSIEPDDTGVMDHEKKMKEIFPDL